MAVIKHTHTHTHTHNTKKPSVGWGQGDIYEVHFARL